MIRYKTPQFWYSDEPKDKYISFALLPFSLIYIAISLILNLGKKPYKSKLRVICIGNYTAGGSGKTPCAIALMELLKARSFAKNPCFLTRGYLGTEKGPLIVDPEEHTAEDVGDEALVLADFAPTILAVDRAAGAQLAEKEGFDLIIMDDGLQNNTLHKDLVIATTHGSKGFGNKFLIPAGPLREPLAQGLAKTDLCIVIGKDRNEIKADLGKTPRMQALYKPDENYVIDTELPYVGFAAIAHPDNFRRTLKGIGINLVGFFGFADHAKLKQSDEIKLQMDAHSKGAKLITTAKDYARLRDDFLENSMVEFLPMKLLFKDEDKLVTFIEKKFKN